MSESLVRFIRSAAMKHRGRLVSAALSLTIGIGAQTSAAGPAGAPPAPGDASATNDNSATLETIVVTAQKRAENLEDVPISIVALTSTQMEKAGIIDVRDLPQMTSALIQIEGSTGNTGQLAIIRGVGSSIAQLGVDSSVATYVDGVYSASKYANTTDINDVERVEVLKGPQGTLFGRNATGGAINIISKQPSDIFSGSGSVSYGRYDETMERMYVTGPLATNLNGSIAVFGRQGGDFAVNIPDGNKFGGRTDLTVHNQLAWQPTGGLDLLASFTYSRTLDHWLSILQTPVPGTVPLGVLSGGVTSYDIDRTSLNFTPTYESDSYRGSVRTQYQLPGMKLVSLTSYQYDTDHLVQDQDTTTAILGHYNIYATNAAAQQEFQLLSDYESRLQWIFGAYYIDFKERYDPLNLMVPGPLAFNAESLSKAGALFGQGTYDLGGNTHFTAGVRYSDEKRSMDSELSVPGTGVIAGPVSLSKYFDKVTWRLSLDHQFTDSILGYISDNRGFKSGAYNILSVSATQTPIASEQLDAYEVGFKSQLADRRVQINGAFYFYNYKNIQVFIVSRENSALTGIEAAGAAKLYGYDGDVAFVPIDGLRLSAGANVEHSYYTKYENASGDVLGPNGGVPATFPSLKGDQLFYAPNLTFNAASVYTHSLANDYSAVVSTSYAYHSKYNEQPSDDHNRIFATGNLNASVALNWPHDAFSVELWGTNITDKRIIGEYLGSYGLTWQVQRPASFGITLGGRF